MNIISKRSILFAFIAVSLSIFIAVVVPVKQKVVISLTPNDEMSHFNKELIESDFLLIKRIQLFKQYYDEDSNVELVSIQNELEKTFYINTKVHFNRIILALSNNKNITKKEQNFFKNSIYKKQVTINPEDGSAMNTAGSLVYLGIEKYDRNEIMVLGKMINEELSQILNNNYKSELKNFLHSVEKVTIPFRLRDFNQSIDLSMNNIKELEKNKDLNKNFKDFDTLDGQTVNTLLRIYNGLESQYLGKKLNNISKIYLDKNSLKNINTDFNDIRKNTLKMNEKMILVNAIDYKRIQNYNMKSLVEERIFYYLLASLNIILFIIFIIFFRNGMAYFIKRLND